MPFAPQHQPNGQRPSEAFVWRRAMPRVLLLAAMAVGCGMPAASAEAQAKADSMRVDGFWISPVQVTAFENGQVVYIAPSGAEARMALTRVQALTLSIRPELAMGEKALADGDDAEAVTQFGLALARTEQPWLKAWAAHRMLPSLNRLGQGAEALGAYLSMAEADVPLSWWNQVPKNALSQLTQSQKRQATNRIESLADTVRSQDVRERLLALVPLLKASPATRQAVPEGIDLGGSKANSNQQADGPETAVPLPSAILPDDPAVAMVAQGAFDDAVVHLHSVLAQGKGTQRQRGQWLYLLGVCQQQIAQRSSNADAEREAALSFMRVAIHMPDHALGPFALLQAAECHVAFGDPAGARKLVDVVLGKGGIGQSTEPAFFEKQQQLLQILQSQP